MEKQEKQLIQEFNAGYLIAKYEPELAKQLLKSSDGQEHIQALISGKDQFEKERGASKDVLHDKTKGKEKGDKERER